MQETEQPHPQTTIYSSSRGQPFPRHHRSTSTCPPLAAALHVGSSCTPSPASIKQCTSDLSPPPSSTCESPWDSQFVVLAGVKCVVSTNEPSFVSVHTLHFGTVDCIRTPAPRRLSSTELLSCSNPRVFDNGDQTLIREKRPNAYAGS